MSPYKHASKQYQLNDIKSLISEKEKEGWSFIYLGANQNAWNVGKTFGLTKGQTMSYNTNNMAATMGTLSTATAAYRSVRATGEVAYGSTSKNFFNDDQQDLTKD